MLFSIITLFPEVFDPILNTSILKRAQQKGLVDFEIINLRHFGEGKHQIVDDKPFGGGVGMVLKPDILAKALKSLTKQNQKINNNIKKRVILTSASGTTYTQKIAKDLVKTGHIIIVCGHYEGVDQRFIDKFIDQEISIGDYVLTGGEIPAMVIIDSITRLISGVLEKQEAIKFESFEDNLLEYPQFTRPADFEGSYVPEILTSGNHQEISNWRSQQSIEKTKKLRPDLFAKHQKQSKKTT